MKIYLCANLNVATIGRLFGGAFLLFALLRACRTNCISVESDAACRVAHAQAMIDG